MSHLQPRTTHSTESCPANLSISHPLGRVLRLLMVPILAISQQGCAFMMPGFDYGFGYFTQKVPIEDVENQVQCELRDFILAQTPKQDGIYKTYNKDTTNPFPFIQLFDPDQPAQVTVTLMTDLNGKVTFTGIDLSRFGLTFLSDLVAISNKLPTLQTYFQPKQEVTASLVFAVPQTYYDRGKPIPTKPIPPTTFYLDSNGKEITPYGVPKPPKTPPPPYTVVIAGLNRLGSEALPSGPDDTAPHSEVKKTTPCDGFTQSWPKRFFIKEWLTNFFTSNVIGKGDGAYVGDQYFSVACHKTLTLKTQIALVFDASAGAQPIVSTYILPISGWTWEVNPQVTETLQIDFAMANQQNQALCDQLLTRNPIGAKPTPGPAPAPAP
jgi:hypothetical protein